MSTYTTYYVWVGITRFDIDNSADELQPALERFLSRLRKNYDGIECGGIKLETVAMHGETIGYGALVHELKWITTDERPLELDLASLKSKGEELKLNVTNVFSSIGLPDSISVGVYHHVDLGG